MTNNFTRRSRKGILFVISAPSGGGKSTLVKRVIGSLPNMQLSVSHTTRSIRQGEEEGRDYYFVSKDTFKGMIERGEFLEWADVFGNYYGTSYKSIETATAAGKDLILDIDIQGADQLRKKGCECSYIFVLPPSISLLMARLEARGTNSQDDIKTRIGKAREEISHYKDYDYIVVNDRLEEAAGSLESIIIAERSRLKNMTEEIKDLDL